MRRVWLGWGVVVFALVLALTAVASAQRSQMIQQSEAQAAAAAAREQALTAQKLTLARDIIRAREDAQQRGPFSEAVVGYWTDRLMKLSIGQLESVAWAGPGADLNDVVTSLSGTVSADGVSADLGDSSRDLVYTKIAPCRIVDTRGATAGALTSNGGFRHFNVAGTTPSWFTPQGGNPCGVPVGATAVAANITVTATAGYGWLRAYPYGGTGNASVINYNGTADLANGLVLPICDPFTTSCTYDMTVVADAAGTHVIIDVMGYFQRVNKAQYRTVNVTSTSTGSMTLSGCTNYMSVTINAPAAGDIVVTANASVHLGHTVGLYSEVDWGIGTTPTDCSHTYGLNGAFAYANAALPTGAYYDFGTVMLRTTVTSAGSHTFYITGTPFGGGTHSFSYGGMKATFTPS